MGGCVSSRGRGAGAPADRRGSYGSRRGSRGRGKPRRACAGELAALVARVLEDAREAAQAEFRRELRASRETLRADSRVAETLRGYRNAGRPCALDLAAEAIAEHHEKNRALYMANANLLVRKAGPEQLARASRRDPADAAGLLRRDEAVQLVRKLLLMQKLDPPIGAIWDEFDRKAGVVDVPEEFDYHTLNACTLAMKRTVWRDLTLLVSEMSDAYEDAAAQLFERVPPTNPSSPAALRHVPVDAFVDEYCRRAHTLLLRTSLPLKNVGARSAAGGSLGGSRSSTVVTTGSGDTGGAAAADRLRRAGPRGQHPRGSDEARRSHRALPVL